MLANRLGRQNLRLVEGARSVASGACEEIKPSGHIESRAGHHLLVAIVALNRAKLAWRILVYYYSTELPGIPARQPRSAASAPGV
jgi:hypothetical protein